MLWLAPVGYAIFCAEGKTGSTLSVALLYATALVFTFTRLPGRHRPGGMDCRCTTPFTSLYSTEAKSRKWGTCCVPLASATLYPLYDVAPGGRL